MRAKNSKAIKEDTIQDLGDVMIVHQNQPGLSLEPHRHPEHQIIIPLQGEVLVSSNNLEYRSGPGQMIYIPSGVHHGFSSANPKGERLIFYLKKNKLSPPKNITAMTLLPSSQLFVEMLFHALIHPKSKSCHGIQITLSQLLEELLESADESSLVSTHTLGLKIADERLKEAYKILKKSYAQPPSMKELAKESGMSLRTMNRLFQVELQRSPKQLLNLIRVERAIALLISSKKTVTEISYEVGFQSNSRFIESFRKVTGRLPTHVRRYGWKQP